MKKIVGIIDQLAAEADALKGLSDLAADHKCDPARKIEYMQRKTRWLRNCHAVLKYAGMGDSLAHVERIASVDSAAHLYPVDISRITGILESARDAIRNGFLGSIKYSLHVEMFDALLSHAGELLAAGHKIPAAVLGRVVLERWLRNLAEKAGVGNWETDKAAALNDGLKTAGVFTQPKWRQIQGYLDIGNLAARWHKDTFSDADVKQMIDFAKVNCIDA